MSATTRPRPYAAGTEVPVARSRQELEALLRKHGAHQIMTGSDTAREMSFIGFTIEGRQYRRKVSHAKDPKRHRSSDAGQREREAWRLLVLLVKAKLNVVALGQASMETEFLADVVLPDGTTVGEQVLPRIAEAYETKAMPRLLPE